MKTYNKLMKTDIISKGLIMTVQHGKRHKINGVSVEETFFCVKWLDIPSGSVKWAKMLKETIREYVDSLKYPICVDALCCDDMLMTALLGCGFIPVPKKLVGTWLVYQPATGEVTLCAEPFQYTPTTHNGIEELPWTRGLTVIEVELPFGNNGFIRDAERLECAASDAAISNPGTYILIRTNTEYLTRQAMQSAGYFPVKVKNNKIMWMCINCCD